MMAVGMECRWHRKREDAFFRVSAKWVYWLGHTIVLNILLVG